MSYDGVLIFGHCCSENFTGSDALRDGQLIVAILQHKYQTVLGLIIVSRIRNRGQYWKL